MVLGPLPDDKPVLSDADHSGALGGLMKQYAPLGVVGILLFTNTENKEAALHSEMAERSRALARLEVKVGDLEDANNQVGYEFIKLRGVNQEIHKLSLEVNQLASVNNKIRNLEESARRLSGENASIQRELLNEIARLERIISSIGFQEKFRAPPIERQPVTANPYQNDGYRRYIPQYSNENDDPSLEE